MSGSLSDVEVLSGNGAETPYTLARPGRESRRRLTVFFLTFLACLTAGQFYNYQRPAIYRSNASLLTVAQQGVDQTGTEADIQHVMLQRQKLLGKPLLDEVLRRLKSDGSGVKESGLTVYQLQSMLSVEPVAETNMVGLQAQGADPALLALVVNTWINSYLDLRAEEIRSLTQNTTQLLQKQYAEMEQKLKQKRADLDTFRKDNEILSLERDENQILSKLKGLNEALNTANEEKIKAKARLDAINAAVSDGRVVVPEGDKRTMAMMEQRAQQLREQLAELDRRFTRNYIALSPTLKVIPEKLQKLENKIKAAVESGRSIVTNVAQQEYAAARQTVDELQKQLEEHKRRAGEFTTRFSEHKAQQDDLVSLEELYREIEGRLVQIQVENRQKYPQVKVVEWAFPPKEPVYPQYQRDAALVLALSVLAGLFVVLLVEFLAPGEKPGAGTTITGVALYPGAAPNSIGHSQHVEELEYGRTPALEHQQQGELSEQDIELFLKGADPAARWIMVLLLHGLALDEIRALQPDDCDLERLELKVRGDSPRGIKLSPGAMAYMPAADGMFPGWQDTDGGLPEKPDLDARIKLAELEHVIGQVSPQTLVSYRPYSPAGPGIAFSDMDTVYPLFKGDG
jgi:polysaccharide biosynthesis transport protein